MEMHYLNFCHSGNPFYDLSPQVTTDFPEAGEELPAGWSRRADSEWVCLTPPECDLPMQGWKVHVSATLDNAERVLALTRAYCTDNSLMYKFIRSRGVLGRRNSKYGDRSASGKFLTIYPTGEAALERVLTELGEILHGEDGPYILSDLRWREGPLYVRYGAFVSRVVRSETGEAVHCIEDPDGRLVPDVRGFSFKVPSWVALPDCLAEALAVRNSGTLRDFPFRAKRALHFSNGGGVYEATDTRTGETVLLKEARPFAGLDESGQDALARLERERWALQTLAGVDCIPRLIDYRVGHQHYFLAREYVPGSPLVQEIYRRNPLVNPEARMSRAEYAEWAARILEEVERGMRAMHERGVVFADLHPNNILVSEDDTVAFIDLETSSEVTAGMGQAIGAPGFRAPVDYRGVDVDTYALGCLRLAVFLPLTIGLPWGPQKVHQLIEAVAVNFPVAGDFADRVWADVGVAAYPGTDDPRAASTIPIWPDMGCAPSVAAGSRGRVSSAIVGELGELSGRGVRGPEEPAWRQQRAGLITTLLSTATPERADRLFPGDVQQFRVPGAGYTLAYGAAGVLWTLAVLGEPIRDDHVDWLGRAVERDTAPRPGCYDGLAGVAYAMEALGQPDRARDLLDRALCTPRADVDDTLYGGLAGLGLAALHFARRAGDEDLAKQALVIADSLGERGDAVPAGPGRVGLLHGSSGIGLFLLRLYAAIGDEALLDRAWRAVRADLAALGWAAGEAQPGAQWRSPVLGGGVAGVGMVLRELLDADGARGASCASDPERNDPDPRAAESATGGELAAAAEAIRGVLSAPFLANSGLFRGRAGTLLALRHLDGGGPQTAGVLREHVAHLGWHVAPLNGGLCFVGDHGLRMSTDLGSGTAGVLLALHAALDGEVRLPFFHQNGELRIS